MSLSQPSGSAWTQSYGYDITRRLTDTASPAGGFGYLYPSANFQLPSAILLPNSAYITNNYDSVARELSTKLINSSSSILDAESYAYNQGNQRTSETNTAGDYRSYTYDSINELKTAIGKEAGGTTNRWHEQHGYAYDAAQNLNYRTNNALIQNFTVNNLNELSNVTRSGTFTVAGTTTSPATNVTVNTTNAFLYADTTFAATNFTLANGNNTFTAIAKDAYGRKDTNSITVNLPATVNYGYDLNGNMLTNNLQVLDYDDENELIRVTVTNQFKKEFVYDGMRRLRIRREFGWISSAWTQTNEIHYVYDGNVIIQLRDTNNVPTLTFTRGSDLSGSLQRAGGIGGLLAMTESSGANSYYHSDGNGNITMLINSYQLPVGKYGYDSFGNPLWESGAKAFVNPFWFSSQLYDPDAGFLQYLYRIYISELDRWLNQDPIQEIGGINLYTYVVNNPINLIDPDGLTWGSNWNFFWSWALGRGDNNRYYPPGSTESEEMSNSPPGQRLRDNFYKNGCKGFNGEQLGQYGTVRAYWETILEPGAFGWGSTAAQVGGFAGASATDNGNGTVTFTIPNDAGTHSFFLHLLTSA